MQHSSAWAKDKKNRSRLGRWLGMSVHWLTKDLTWFFLLLLGIGGATVCMLLDATIELLFHARVDITRSLEDRFWVPAFLFWVVSAVFYALVSGGLSALSPASAGSGIPQVKSIMGGFDVEHFLSMKTLAAKASGLVMGVASGLSIGREGPNVHLVACLANGLRRFKLFRAIDGHTAMAAAAAVGVSATFGAPIGGVLFSIEVTATYYLVSSLWKGFFAAVCGTVFVRLFGSMGLVALFSTDFEGLPYDPIELALYSLLGIVCGGVAHLFVKAAKRMVEWERAAKISVWKTILVITLVTAVLLYPFSAIREDEQHMIGTFFDVEELEGWNAPHRLVTLAAFSVLKFILTAVAVTLPLPAGCFAPVFALGASFGRLVGETVAVLAPHLNVVPAGYAVVGAASLAGGVTRTISTSVIVIELTGQVYHALPILISVLLACLVGNYLDSHSIYDQLMILRGLPYMPRLSYYAVYNKIAANIMRTDVTFLTPDMTFKDVEAVLNEHPAFSSFPMVEDPVRRVLLGAVSRTHLEAVVNKRRGDYEMFASSVSRPPSRGEPNGLPAKEGDEEKTVKKPEEQESRLLVDIDVSDGDSDSEGEMDNVNSPLTGSRASSRTPQKAGRRLEQLSMKGSGQNKNPSLDNLSPALATAMFPESLEVHLSGQVPFDLSGGELGSAGGVCPVDRTTFSISDRIPLSKVHFFFTMMNLKATLVTSAGRLVGVVTKGDLIKVLTRERTGLEG